MKRFIFLSLSLLLLLILIPGCFTFQTAPSAVGERLRLLELFSSNPSTINPGGTSTLLWTVTGANSVSIDQGIGPVEVVGTRVVSPTASTVYTISATNSAGTVTRSAVTTVNSVWPLQPAPASFLVTSILANTAPSSLTGCSNLYAYITANGPGTVTYNWESTEGGGYSYTWNVTFPTAGSQKITLPVEMSALPSGSYRVHVLTPNDSVSNSVYYATCVR